MFRSVRITAMRKRGDPMSDMSIGGNKYEPEKPLAHRAATAFGTLAVGVRRVGRLHIDRHRRRHHHAVDRARLMRRQPERKAEVNPVVLSRVARLSSPRRAVVHRGHAEPAGDAMTRCAGARAPPGCGYLRWQRRRPVRKSPRRLPLLGNPEKPYDSHNINQNRQDRIWSEPFRSRRTDDDTAEVHSGQRQAKAGQPSVRRTGCRQYRFRRHQICHHEQA